MAERPDFAREKALRRRIVQVDVVLVGAHELHRSQRVAWPGTLPHGIRKTAAGEARKALSPAHNPSPGVDDIEMAGSAPLAVAWAEEHHKPAEEWTVPLDIATVLHEVDDD